MSITSWFNSAIEGYRANKKNAEDCKKLIAAINARDEIAVEALLKSGVDSNGLGSRELPIVHAIYKGSEEIFDLLHEHGAKLNISETEEMIEVGHIVTPLLSLAIGCGQEDMALKIASSPGVNIFDGGYSSFNGERTDWSPPLEALDKVKMPRLAALLAQKTAEKKMQEAQESQAAADKLHQCLEAG